MLYSTAISPNDVDYMWIQESVGSEAAVDHYFNASQQFIGNLQRELGNVRDKTCLEIYSRYGRFTRYFVAMFQKVTICDVNGDALNFCSQHFLPAVGANDAQQEVITTVATSGSPPLFPSAMRETGQLGTLSLPSFDLVAAISVFTHVPRPVWLAWMREAFLLTKNWFVFTTINFDYYHSQTHRTEIQGQTGFWYQADEASPGWGKTVIDPVLVREQVAKCGGQVLNYWSSGNFDRYQDVWLCSRA